MSFVHIKKIQKPDKERGMKELYAVSAVGIATPQGKKLIPNPAGMEALLFESLEAAEDAIQRAGFDYEFEGKKTFSYGAMTVRPAARSSSDPYGAAKTVLLQRLQDREPTVVANSAYALGALQAYEAIDPLVNALGHEDANVRKNVAEALARLAPASAPALQRAYEASLKSVLPNAPYIRLTVMTALLEMTQHGQSAVVLDQGWPIVSRALDDESWLVRAQAALVVGNVAALQMEEQQRR